MEASRHACEAAALHFVDQGQIASLQPFGGGNINDSWLLTLHTGRQWLLQRLNPHVFPNPELIMRNLRLVLERLAAAIKKNKIPVAEYQIFSIAAARDGSDIYRDQNGATWRLISYIPNSRCRHTVDSAAQALELGRKLGLFHRLVSELDPAELIDPLPDFHNTPKYLERYDEIIATHRAPARHAPASSFGSGAHSGAEQPSECEESANPRRGIHQAQDRQAQDRQAQDRQFCRNFIDTRRELVTILEQERRELTTQVIHGDPKVANFLFDRKGSQAISLVDLDTLKPGLLLHDIGDALRSCCARGGEEAADPQQVVFDAALFDAWLRGYHGEFGFGLTQKEQKRIVAATMLITFELGLRFFTDHLNGDKYFKISFPGQNLTRALIQFHLVRRQEEQAGRLADATRRVFK